MVVKQEAEAAAIAADAAAASSSEEKEKIGAQLVNAAEYAEVFVDETEEEGKERIRKTKLKDAE